MNDARTAILGKLRTSLGKELPFPAAESVNTDQPVVPIAADEDLLTRFRSEVERVKGVVHVADTPDAALLALRAILAQNDVRRATAWDEHSLPIDGVYALLAAMNVERVSGANEVVETAQAGITGCDWAIAATGTLVLSTGAGRSRMASLLPPIHVALMRSSQLIPRLEDWVAGRYAARLQELRTASNVTLITGCSRTADIEMSPVFGVHGPLQFHVVVYRDV
jgi:L-lactate dehydrogenase complex protein LldG